MINKKKIENLRKKIEDTLVPLIDSDYVLLDIPFYGNIGDHLIYEGELCFLNKNISKYKLQYSSSALDFDEKKISKNDIILFQGGGNFGDIYPNAQKFRLKVAEMFPKNKIIFFPQTVYYDDLINLKNDIINLNKHDNLYICARDLVSFELLKKHGLKTNLLLLPDMAFCIDSFNVEQKANNKKEALLMERVDVEMISIDEKLIESIIKEGYELTVRDWPTFYNNFSTKQYAIRNKIRRVLLKAPFSKLFFNKINEEYLKEYYIKMGIEFMQPFQLVATTRLHGMILAILMGKDIIMLDNNYGKLSSFYNTWLKDFDNIKIYP